MVNGSWCRAASAEASNPYWRGYPQGRREDEGSAAHPEGGAGEGLTSRAGAGRLVSRGSSC